MAIQTVGVLGCGLMGSGIAQVCAQSGYRTIVREVEQDLVDEGLQRIDRFLADGQEADIGKSYGNDASRGSRGLRHCDRGNYREHRGEA